MTLFSTYFHKLFSDDKHLYRLLTNLMGFSPRNITVYKLAFRHKSSALEVRSGVKSSNERLEFLGDAVLGTVVAEMLFKKFPYRDEGFLTEMRSKIVSRENLNRLSLKIGLDKLIENNLDRNNKSKSMFGDAFEALIGAIYLDRGYLKARTFILERIIKNHIDIDLLEQTQTNFKSKLLEWAQKEKKTLTYEVVDSQLPDQKLIKVRVLLDNEEMGSGLDFSKKKAEQIAAEAACKALNI